MATTCQVNFNIIVNFGSWSAKLGGTVPTIKKMTHNDNGPGPGRNYGEAAVFTFSRKVFFLPKTVFFPKEHPKFAKRLIFIWEKGNFLFAQLFPVVARKWLELRSEFFWVQKLCFWPKNPCTGHRLQVTALALSAGWIIGIVHQHCNDNICFV